MHKTVFLACGVTLFAANAIVLILFAFGHVGFSRFWTWPGPQTFLLGLGLGLVIAARHLPDG